MDANLQNKDSERMSWFVVDEQRVDAPETKETLSSAIRELQVDPGHLL